MLNFSATVSVTLKTTVNDPEGLTITSALHSLEFEDVQSVRVGKIFTITLQSSTKKSAEQQIDEICKIDRIKDKINFNSGLFVI